MPYFYTDPNREESPFALPDAEVFYVPGRTVVCHFYGQGKPPNERTDIIELPGWYVQACFPGCIPDGDPDGPYGTEAEAIEAWRDTYGEWE